MLETYSGKTGFLPRYSGASSEYLSVSTTKEELLHAREGVTAVLIELHKNVLCPQVGVELN